MRISRTRPRRGVLLWALVMLAPAGLAAGCNQAPPHSAGAIAIVIGNHANMPEPQISSQIQTVLDDSLLSQDMMYVVSVSGDPGNVYQQQLATACGGGPACTGAKASFNTGVVNTLVSRAKATTAQSDPLDAILIAAKDVDSANTSGPKQIIVLDNGLQTTGDLTLQSPGALSVLPSAVVQQLEATPGKLAPLNGIKITWSGLGATYTPQQQVPFDSIDQLQSLWTAILQAGGAQVSFEEDSGTGAGPVPGLPAVDTVSFATAPPHGSKCYRLREDQIGFEPGLAVFRDPAQARQILQPIAQSLISAGLDATVIGTAALPGSEWTTLSKQRAKVAAGVLESLGVPAASLTTDGVGVHFSGFVPDTSSSGQLIETEAVQNRLVIVQPVGVQCS